MKNDKLMQVYLSILNESVEMPDDSDYPEIPDDSLEFEEAADHLYDFTYLNFTEGGYTKKGMAEEYGDAVKVVVHEGEPVDCGAVKLDQLIPSELVGDVVYVSTVEDSAVGDERGDYSYGPVLTVEDFTIMTTNKPEETIDFNQVFADADKKDELFSKYADKPLDVIWTYKGFDYVLFSLVLDNDKKTVRVVERPGLAASIRHLSVRKNIIEKVEKAVDVDKWLKSHADDRR